MSHVSHINLRFLKIIISDQLYKRQYITSPSKPCLIITLINYVSFSILVIPLLYQKLSV